MRLIISLVVVLSVALAVHGADDGDDFDDFDMYEEAPSKPVAHQVQVNNEAIDDSDDGLVEDEFDPYADKDEFEFGGTDNEPNFQDQADAKKTEPKLTIAKVPMNFKQNWDSYWIEILCCLGLIVYFANYAMGKNKNSKIADRWLSAHKSFLEDNFALVGDDYKKETDSTATGIMMKESDSIFTLWCSGRVCCEGMLTELKLIKRQDLLSLTMGMLSKIHDQVVFKAEIAKDSTMDGFVFAVCNKKVASKMLKDMTDIKQFCVSVAKPDEKYNIPTGFSVLSELAEATSAVLDNRVVTMLNKYSDIIESIHISDQFSGPQPAESTENAVMKLPETKKMVVVSFNMPEKNYEMEDFRPILQLVIYLVDKLKRFKLSREGKLKSDKNRSSREQEFLKSLHAQRMENAAQKVSDKRKQEKEKMMSETDVDKQMKLEKKMKRKESKKAMPKTKSMSINL